MRNGEQWRRTSNDLSAFVAVARAGGFRDGARASGVSASSLSEAVRRLETQLGVRLLNRTTRSVAPTEAGARLLERLAPALGEIEAALDVVNAFRDRPAGTLGSTCRRASRASCCRRSSPPFLKAYPDIRLEVIVEDGFVDVLAAGCDAGIRYDERLEQDMIAVPIGPRVQRFATAASPRLSRRARPARTIRATCSPTPACAASSPSGAMPTWEFERDGEVVRVDPTGPLVVRLGAAVDLAVERRRRRARHHPPVRGLAAAARSTAARWSRCWSPGGRASPGRFSTIPAAAICRRRCAPSSISSRAKGQAAMAQVVGREAGH